MKSVSGGRISAACGTLHHVKVETVAEQLFFTTVQLALTDGTKQWSGTSFIYSVETDAGTAHFLVTNKHVLAGASTVVFRLHRGDANKPLLGTAIEMTVDSFNDDVWAGHPTSSVDVAVLPFSSVLEAAIKQQLGTPFFRSVGPDVALTSAQANSLDAIEEVTFIGYPSGIYDKRNLLPVLRKGTTATPIVVDYEGLPAFLIDASVFPGSSGSPVFIFNRGMYTTRDNTTHVSSRLLLIGVISAVHVRRVEGRVLEIPTAFSVNFDEPIDLGIVWKASAINDCVDLLLARAGLHRTAGQVPISDTAAPTPADKALDDITDITE